MRPAHAVETSVAKFLDQLHLKSENVFIVSLSGGIDSVALLSAVVSWAQQSHVHPKVEGFHVHHGIRGEEADRDARHCFSLCRKLHLPLHVVHENLNQQLGPGKPSLETLCREKRRSHLRTVAAARKSRHVLFGHHMEDQAETLLGNLLRGCGLRGMTGMHPVAPLENSDLKILRPLLDCRKEQLRDYLQHCSLTAIEDSSNQSEAHRRNRLRHHLIPTLEKESPEFTIHLHHLAAEMRLRWQHQEKILDPRIQKICRQDSFVSFPPDSWEGLEDHQVMDLFREVLRSVIHPDQNHSSQLNRGHLAGLLNLTRETPTSEIELPGNRVARRCGRWIHVSPQRLSKPPEWDSMTLPPHKAQQLLGFHWEIQSDVPLQARRWQRDDRWPGRTTKSVECLRKAGIPADLRPYWPVLTEPETGKVVGSPGIHGPKISLIKAHETEIDALGFHLQRILQPSVGH